MSTILRSPTSALRRPSSVFRLLPFAWLFAALGVYWLALIHQLGAQWSVYEEYSYGWAVPFLCGFLVWQRIQGSHHRPLTTDHRLPTAKAPSSILYLLFALCALLYAPTRFFHEANPIWRLTSLLWAIEVVGITLCALRLMTEVGGRTAEVRSQKSEVGNQTSVLRPPFSSFVFPICFFLVAVPWPSGIEIFLVQTLTHLNVSATIEVLGWFGIPALQHGNVIEVATGEVGINEACSGIRSFQATLMISLFLGEFYSLGILRRALLVLAGFVLSFLFNMARTTLLTWVAVKKGVAAIAAWHDPAGVTILVACFLTLWLAAVWLRGKQGARSKEQGVAGGGRPGEIGGQLEYGIDSTGQAISRASACEVANQTSRAKEGGGQPAGKTEIGKLKSEIPTPSTFNFQLSTLQKLAIALLAWFVLVEAGTQFWFHLHENSAAAREVWSVNVEGTNPRLTKMEIPEYVRAGFKADEYVEAQWRDDSGNSWQLFYFRWFPAHSLNKRVAVQLAKTHGPEKCLPAVGVNMKSDLGIVTVPVGDLKFTFRQYVFLADERHLHVFYAIYEDVTGSAVLANRRQDTASRIAAAFAGSRNNGQRYLEMAVAGPEKPEQARTALRGELNKLIASKP